MSATLSPAHVAAALALRDLTDPAQGAHAVGLLLDAAVDALVALALEGASRPDPSTQLTSRLTRAARRLRRR
jgi:hypothetical protein